MRETSPMTVRQKACSGLEIDETRFDAEFRAVVNAMFCACLAAREDRADHLARELFRQVDLQNRPLVEAADALGVAVSEAREIIGKVRRDIAVVLALGLCAPIASKNRKEEGLGGCGCGTGRTRPFPRAS